ncbi:hypothetical protein BGZ51_002604 [Haplosporangium sp. Z 767]|nr:hypothetical protein BGZ51_002604 [Haplosporangium sp. Z 767]
MNSAKKQSRSVPFPDYPVGHIVPEVQPMAPGALDTPPAPPNEAAVMAHQDAIQVQNPDPNVWAQEFGIALTMSTQGSQQENDNGMGESPENQTESVLEDDARQ